MPVQARKVTVNPEIAFQCDVYRKTVRDYGVEPGPESADKIVRAAADLYKTGTPTSKAMAKDLPAIADGLAKQPNEFPPEKIAAKLNPRANADAIAHELAKPEVFASTKNIITLLVIVVSLSYMAGMALATRTGDLSSVLYGTVVHILEVTTVLALLYFFAVLLEMYMRWSAKRTSEGVGEILATVEGYLLTAQRNVAEHVLDEDIKYWRYLAQWTAAPGTTDGARHGEASQNSVSDLDGRIGEIISMLDDINMHIAGISESLKADGALGNVHIIAEIEERIARMEVRLGQIDTGMSDILARVKANVDLSLDAKNILDEARRRFTGNDNSTDIVPHDEDAGQQGK